MSLQGASSTSTATGPRASSLAIPGLSMAGGPRVTMSPAKRQWERLQQALLARKDRLSQWVLPRATGMQRASLAPTIGLAGQLTTYQLEPETRFDCDRVRVIIQEVFVDNLERVQYDELAFKRLGVQIGEEVRSRIKRLNFDRYRLVCYVQLVQRRNQGFYSRARFLWDSERDDCASGYFETAHVFASCLVLGVYKE
ncbi:dynein light chain Tctex-type protein 2B-like [Bacillus rossius redtenbacheri]|uniref:dynein light chain Tctex-type protein 2B-like n=1 Tax=Bacillus rossius redtenbacheri TaxID=93214 RepID=UPI002FDCA878